MPWDFSTGFGSDGRPVGFFSDDDATLYVEAIYRRRGGVIVEIGSWMGRSLSYAIPACKFFGGKIYAIDTWGEWTISAPDNAPLANSINETLKNSGSDYFYNCFIDNLKQITGSDCVIPVRKSSVEASKDFSEYSVDLVYIDGSHDYDSVKEDINTWWPKIKMGGYIGGHDFHPGITGVYKAVQEFVGTRPFEYYNTSWLFRKV